MSLGKKLSFLFLLIAVLPLSAVATLAYWNGRETIENQTINHLFSVNALKKKELEAWLGDKSNLIEILASTHFFREEFSPLLRQHGSVSPESREEEQRVLDYYVAPFLKGGGFDELFIMEPGHGTVVYSSHPYNEGKIKEALPYFIKGREATFVQNVYYSMTLQKPSITMSTPIRDRQGDLVAVLAGRVDLSALSGIIGGTRSNFSSEDTYLVNKFNFFITEPLFGGGYALRKTVNTEGVRLGLEKRTGFGFYRDYRGVPVIGAYQWLPEWDLVLITEVDQSEAFAPIYRLRNTTGIFGLGMALIAALVGLLIARTLARPLNRLAVSAREIGKGDLATPITTTDKGEIGNLARSFDRMRSELREILVSRDDLAREAERRKKAMAELEQERDFSDKVINGLPGVFYLFDENLRFQRWNRDFETLSGYSSEEFAGISPLDLFGDEDRDRVAERIGQVFQTGSAEVEVDLLARDGSRIPHFFRGLLLETGENRFLIGMGVDISSRVRAEEALKSDRKRLLAILDGIEDVIYVADPETYELLHVNEAFSRNWGADVIGKKCHKVLQDRDTPCPFCTNEKIFGEYAGRSYVWEFQNESNRRWYQCSDKVIQWVDGRMVRFEIATDITVRKLMEEELTRTNQDLGRSNQELEQFAYVASHDLQEPLRMVASYTQLLASRYEEQLDDKAKKYINYAVEGATRMQGLVNDLLALSRVGTRGKPPEKTDCAEIVEKVLRGLVKRIEESGAEVRVGAMPVVMADPTQLGQLFQNLIGNAVKFRGEDSPEVEVSAEKNGGEWVFRIRDNGIGIEPQFHERVFTVFQRLHERGKYEGTGIGLAIAKKIVERHGGRIWIESAEGAGSSFWFTLPVSNGERGISNGG